MSQTSLPATDQHNCTSRQLALETTKEKKGKKKKMKATLERMIMTKRHHSPSFQSVNAAVGHQRNLLLLDVPSSSPLSSQCPTIESCQSHKHCSDRTRQSHGPAPDIHCYNTRS